MQMQVGTFRFEVAPGSAEYQELQRRGRRRWGTRDRYGLPPELEDLGRDANRIDLRGTVWVDEAADIEALADLHTLAGLEPGTGAETLPVFLGGGAGSSGQYLGLWAVTRLEETERSLRENGVPIRIDFRVSLLEEGSE
ncbi:MAG: phage tail protein [Rhodospirillaceae bacterium]|nr:phage tail protein [Rhodospirillaceae bacterium]